tara:strand:- start:1512 stop:1736 length:225 start_codon:yes stop_codon:yes gene_type:complete
MIKNYKNKDITIHWDPSKCSHAAVCINLLPKVYNPTERPWIKIENASSEELKNQISKCPSGALTFTSHSKEDSL